MRLWSIDPQYLDSKGLVALWREGLLAKKVLAGQTRGYRQHPQLFRFKKHSRPLQAINLFLANVLKEAEVRGYSFDARKIKQYQEKLVISVSDQQLLFEFAHLQKKLKKRDFTKYKDNLKVKNILPNNIFKKRKGLLEKWEKIF